jgi:DNA-directed RNA polymerase specialized sigma subunit
MMKYEPINPQGDGLIEWLMMPFAETKPETDWELIDLISDVLSTLSESDRQALHGVFYERKTYQEVAEDFGIKAKSHAWRKTDTALKNLKRALLADDKFLELMGEKYGINL